LGLEQLGKKVTYFNDTGVPEILKFLPKANDVRTELTSKDQFDVVISCDCGSLVRLGDKFSKFKNSYQNFCINNTIIIRACAEFS